MLVGRYRRAFWGSPSWRVDLTEGLMRQRVRLRTPGEARMTGNFVEPNLLVQEAEGYPSRRRVFEFILISCRPVVHLVA